MKSVGPGRGHFETMRVQGETWTLAGWICHPDLATASIVVTVDGKEVAAAAPTRREDVAAIFSWIPHAGDSGFRFEIPCLEVPQRVVVEARDGRRPLTAIRTTLHPEFADLPHPPTELMLRVSGSPDPGFFDADGVRSYTEFVEAVQRYRDWNSLPRMLDWGCGCGRVTRCFLRGRPALEVHGADIDSEAVAWCAERLPGGRFRAILPQPPTDYPTGHFPLVIGYSVFSHLNRDLQHAWLGEMQRIIAPGGLFLASVHGPFAARFCFPQSAPAKGLSWSRKKKPFDVLAKGYIDAGEDLALEGVAPAGYYRGIFQSPEWTRVEWSKHFRVLEIVEGGMQNYQDLVILERR